MLRSGGSSTSPTTSTPGDRARLEAALEGAGVLDAWVGPDGHVDGDAPRRPARAVPPGRCGATRVGRPRPTVPGADGAAVIRPAVVDASTGVTEDVVGALLDRIALRPAGAADEAAAWSRSVGRDRRPVVGRPAARTDDEGVRPVHRRRGPRGRASAPARASSTPGSPRPGTGRTPRRRDRRAAQSRLDALRAWLAAQPSHDALVRAWTTAEERESALARAEAELAEVAAAARARRAEAADRQRRLEELAATHDLPTTRQGLDAQAERLDAARDDIARAAARRHGRDAGARAVAAGCPRALTRPPTELTDLDARRRPRAAPSSRPSGTSTRCSSRRRPKECASWRPGSPTCAPASASRPSASTGSASVMTS